MHESKTIDTKTDHKPIHKPEYIDNFKKGITELEFMDKVKALYNDISVRNDIDKWKGLLGEYMLCNVDVSQKISSLLVDFLKENHEMAYDILVLLNECFKWTEGSDELIDIFLKEEEIISLAKLEQNIIYMKKAARILFKKADHFYKLENVQRAIEIYKQITELCQVNIGDDTDEIFASSLYIRANLFVQIKKYDLATADYCNLINYYQNHDSKGIKVLVANALLRKANILTTLGKYRDGLLAFVDIVNRYKDDTQEEIIDVVATALYCKGICLSKLGGTVKIFTFCCIISPVFKKIQETIIFL